MTIQVPKIPEEPTALQKFLTENNPTPWNPGTVKDVLEKTLAQRREEGPQFTQVLNGLSESVCDQMTQDFTELSSRVIAEWSLTQPEFKDEKAGKKLSSVYHRGPHGAEMGKDAELLLAKQAETLFASEAQRKLFIKMAQVAHAIHDVVQDKGPPNNEIESARKYTEACHAIIDKNTDMSIEQKEEMKKVSEHFGWETIVVGTTFDFKKKRPVVDILNEASRTFTDAPKELDPAVACATFACGKNDTRRMEVNADSYATDPQLQRLQKLQAAATGGADNIFMQFMSQRDAAKDPKFVSAATHMIGQNCRMICELKTHFGKDGDDAKFAEFLTNMINKASTTFDGDQHQDLKAEIQKSQDLDLFFNKLISSFKGDFGEIAFAKGLNSDSFDKAVADFNALYPENRFDLAGKGDLWQQYGIEAQAFIESIEAKIAQIKDDPVMNEMQKEEKIKEFKVQVIADLALYGAHQMGAALIRENEETVKAYDILIEESHAKLKGIQVNQDIPKDSKGLQEFIVGLKSHQQNPTHPADPSHPVHPEDKENQNPNPNPSLERRHSFSFSKPPGQDHTQAIKLCEGLLKATQERDRIQAQILNLSKSENKELGPPPKMERPKSLPAGA